MRSSAYRIRRTALFRAVPHLPSPSRTWPDLTEASAAVEDWVEWLAGVWQDDEVVEAISYASADLAAQVDALLSNPAPAARRARSTVQAVVRYLLRREARPTPFGFFAGVAPAAVDARARVEWGGDHVAVARASAPWLANIVAQLESCPSLQARLPLVANSTATVRGDRLIIAYQPTEQDTGAAEVSLRHTAPVQAALSRARSPITFAELAESLHTQFTAASMETVTGMLTEMVARRALITSLHAPATTPDALAHLLQQLQQLQKAGADDVEGIADLIAELRVIHGRLEEHNRTPARKGRAIRRELADQMTALISRPGQTRRNPLVVDLRLDATAILPSSVAHEVERAAHLLARLSAYPFGTREWSDYLQQFWDRYGIGCLVPLADVIADLGYPDGYPGTGEPVRRPAVSRRDEVLAGLAQTAALDGRHEVVLDEALLQELDLAGDKLRLPPHLEVGVRVDARTADALNSGAFVVEVVTVSRSAGVLAGRFLPVLKPGDAAVITADYAGLPASDRDTVPVQISFPPLHSADAHIARTGQILPTVLSLAEHQGVPGERVLTVEDLAVGCDGHRLYLAVPALGTRVEAVAAHALNLRVHTPPLARLLIELGRAQAAQVTKFDWGPAATRLPFRPRLRYGRIVLAAAQWRLSVTELPGPRASWLQWETALTGWRDRRRLPRRILLAEGDRRLPLDLDEPGHRALLRAHLAGADHASLLEAPGPEAMGWCGGHAHELITTVTAAEPHPWPPLPTPTRARLRDRGHGHPPGISSKLLAKLYGPAQLQDLLLAEHLPVLLDRLGNPAWWFLRFQDGQGPHLRLRITFPGGTPAMSGTYTATISEWTAELHQAGLARETTYATCYPEVGRWGSGQAYQLAEHVFAADSSTVLTQLRTAARPDRLALAAAHTIAVAVAFTGSVPDGIRWLIDHLPAASPAPVARPTFSAAVALADPHDDWSALRAAPGGREITTAWRARNRALAAYRAYLPAVERSEGDCAGVIADQVLQSLLHTHFIRAHGIDRPAEALTLYLARSAALAWTAKAEHR